MHVGILTAPFHNDPLETILDLARGTDFKSLEVDASPGSAHFDMENPEKLAEEAGAAGLEISSLGTYMNPTNADEAAREETQQHILKVAKLCRRAGTDTLCLLGGLPPAGMSKEETLEKILAPFTRELAKVAADEGIKIGFENWTATVLGHLGQWDLFFFDLVPDENIGLNFDPSHLYWQDIDYMMAIERYADRIFHTHAKDTEVIEHKKSFVGNQGQGWWRYVIPGYGHLDWGAYIGRLRLHGYDGVLSIEHEDGAVGREEGFLQGLRHLQQFC
jgi:sugar phosphate isomerase/epimerase